MFETEGTDDMDTTEVDKDSQQYNSTAKEVAERREIHRPEAHTSSTIDVFVYWLPRRWRGFGAASTRLTQSATATLPTRGVPS
jgi:hypothetical protein